MAISEYVQYTVLGSILLVGIGIEIFFYLVPGILRGLSSLITFVTDLRKNSSGSLIRLWQIYEDFRSRKYYRPWRSTNDMVVVTNKKHITELSEASELSQRAIYADMFGFKYTLNKFDHNEQKAARYRFYGRVLQVNGPTQLAIIHSDLQAILQKTFASQLEQGKKTVDGWTSVRLAFTLRKTVSRMMGLAFFGDKLVSNEEFSTALLQHPQDMVKSMGAFQITPNFLAPYVHAIITKRGKAMHTLLKHIIPAFQQGPESSQPVKPTIAHSMAELNPDPDYWSPALLAQAILGIWFAASHQPWMNLDFVMLELCARPDYIEALRVEVGDPSVLDYAAVEKLPLLDSFLKEAVRFNPLDTLAIRRKAMRPFTFSKGGPYVAEGKMACVSLYDAMHDEGTYPGAETFVGDRFTKTASRFTDVSEKYPVWGFGSLACPGRFHASLMIKMVLIHLISRFDFRLEDEKAARQWKWETFTMPFESTRVQFREREI